MPRAILIVDDNAVERAMLVGFLKDRYEVVTAANGKEMIAVLRKRAKSISAILLDIVMPEMDGYRALQEIRENAECQQIPVIVVTGLTDEDSQVKAMSLGANGYVFKPFNKELLAYSLENAISLREKSALVNAFRQDSLTGLPNRSRFFEIAESLIRSQEPGYYVISSLDIENFKVINDQYGFKAGDEVLKHVAAVIDSCAQLFGGACCRHSADKFGMLYPAKFKDTDAMRAFHEEVCASKQTGRSIKLRIGRYCACDLDVPASAMYDRATLAEESIRGRYDISIAEYTDAMRARLLDEQKIVNDMDRALDAGEFKLWLQPQYNHATGALIGAEALVRWVKDGEVISPDTFVPVFERNGFIYEMDQHVWEEACKLLRRWLDEGRAPLPLSVNVSRCDVFHKHFLDTLVGIVARYGIPYDLLRLEVTESAFSESTGQITARVNELINLGFTVEIDDFGSGYSSLNTLKDVPAPILKLDMKFFEHTENQQRGGNIVQSVVRMAKWLGMAVIAEGVETRKQADFLKSLGCYYIQGYCYARPMPACEYEKLQAEGAGEHELTRLQTLETLDSNEFWNPDSMETLIFNSYVGGACIFEYCDGKSELLRANEQYACELGGLAREGAALSESSLVGFLDGENKDKLVATLEEAIGTRKESSCEVRLSDGDRFEHVRVTTRVIAHADDSYLFYCVIVNMTEQREAERRQAESSQHLEAIMDNLPCGAALYRYDGRSLSVVHINKSYWGLVGRDPVDYSQASVLGVIHPDDRSIASQEIEAAIRQGRNADVNLRILCGSSEYRPFHVVARIVAEAQGTHLLFVSYVPLSERALSIQETLPVALATMMSVAEELSYVKDRDLRYVCCSQSVVDLLGLDSTRDIIGKSDADLFDERIAEAFVADDLRIIESGESLVGSTETILGQDGTLRLARTSKYPIRDASGNVMGVYGISRDITAQREKESQLELLASSIPGGLAAYSISERGLRMLYFNDGFFKFSGCTREEYAKLVADDPLAFVFEEDKPHLRAMVRDFSKHKVDGHTNGCLFRCHTKEGGYRWMSMKTVLSQLGDDRFVVNVVQLDVTEQQEEKERLRMSEELNRLAIEHSGNIITRFDVRSRTLTLPSSFNPIFVLPQVLENMPEEQIALGRVSPDTADAYRELFEGIVRGSAAGTATYKQNSTKGWRWLEARYTTVFSDAGLPVSAAMSFSDVTEELEKEVVYNKWQQSLEERPEESYTLFRCNLSRGTSFDSWEGTLLQVDFDDAKGTFDELTAEYVEQCVCGEDRRRYLAFVRSDALLAEYHRGRRSATLEYRERNDAGATRWLRLTIDLVEYPGSKDIEAYLMFENIDAQKRADLLTLERAETDPLTGILNRATFIARVEQVLRGSGGARRHALLMLDVDNFKQINDTLGHGVGDEVLRDLTGQIASMLRHDDLVGRMGGDEFFVFLENVSGKAAVAAKAERICSLRIGAAGTGLAVTTSIGIAMVPQDGSSFDTLYEKVDAALYEAKKRGKNGYRFAAAKPATEAAGE